MLNVSIDAYPKSYPTSSHILPNYFADDNITVVASNVTQQSTKSDDATASTASMIDNDTTDDDELHTSLQYYPTYTTTYQTSRPTNKKLTPAQQSPFHLQPATPMATQRSAWTQIVQANNLQQLPGSATIFNPQHLVLAGNVAKMSPICRPDRQMLPDLRRHHKSGDIYPQSCAG